MADASWHLIPSRASVRVLAGMALASAVVLLAGAPLAPVATVAMAVMGAGLVLAALDLALSWRAWQSQPLQIVRRLPKAFALGAPTVLSLTLVNEGRRAWLVTVFDEVDPQLDFHGLPQTLTVPPGARAELRYTATPRQRGLAQMGATQLRWRSQWGCFEVGQRLGQPSTLRVYPNFAAVAGYDWLAGDRRLAQIGIKTYAQRGQGTDFRQLTEYRRGHEVRNIDWKATLHQRKPIVREFQDDRDQRVFFLLDCGRRMRAEEGEGAHGDSHFDQALNALMLLSHVALADGDEVGAMTFGNPPGEQRYFAPRKSGATLNALMNRLHDLQPSASHSDYLLAAQQAMRQQPKRALVILLTNFRDEDSSELMPAVRLLRRRHLVLVASLRERVLREMSEQPLRQAIDATQVAAAHLFEQSRHDAFAQTLGRDALSLDVEPRHLAVALVNRYHAVKRAKLL